MTEERKITDAERWVKEVLAEIDGFDPDLMCPANPVRENEKVVATIEDDYLQRIFSLSMFYSRERDRNNLESVYTSDDSRIELKKSAWIAAEKAQILVGLFWAYIREFVEVWDARNMGIRAGWKIVTFDIKRPTNVFDIMFGGGPQDPQDGNN